MKKILIWAFLILWPTAVILALIFSRQWKESNQIATAFAILNTIPLYVFVLNKRKK